MSLFTFVLEWSFSAHEGILDRSFQVRQHRPFLALAREEYSRIHHQGQAQLLELDG